MQWERALSPMVLARVVGTWPGTVTTLSTPLVDTAGYPLFRNLLKIKAARQQVWVLAQTFWLQSPQSSCSHFR